MSSKVPPGHSGDEFKRGYNPPPQKQDRPGIEGKMTPQPVTSHLPSKDGGFELYKAAGKLTGKKALITGGDSGIGRAVSILFAMEGAEVSIAYLAAEEEDAQHTKKQVQKNGGKIHLFQTDVTCAKNCKELVDKAVKSMGGINILVNNAAYQAPKDDISEISEEQWVKTFDTNIHPYFYLAKYSLPHMTAGDTIINTTSVNAYTGPAAWLDYSTTKGAIVAFTRSLSNQQVKKGIRVNAVAPGPIWTPFIVSTLSEEKQKQFGAVQMGRPGQPSECATCYVFLASCDSSYISGQTLHPNGGTVVNG